MHVEAYAQFCVEYGLHLLPISDLQLARYQQYLSYSLTSSDSISNYVSGVKTLALITGNIIPEQLYLTNSMARALKHVLAHPLKQVAPMTQEILKKIAKIIDVTDQVQLVSWTAILLGFIMFL